MFVISTGRIITLYKLRCKHVSIVNMGSYTIFKLIEREKNVTFLPLYLICNNWESDFETLKLIWYYRNVII